MTKQTVLIVDDNYDNLHAMASMVESFGYEARTFQDSVAALAALKDDATQGRLVDLALLDINMPAMNGYELLAALKQMPQYAALSCIMVTARDQDDQILEGYQFGADYYITKPFTSQQLKFGIELYLGGQTV
jgi:CheY-like chemotaxis protein